MMMRLLFLAMPALTRGDGYLETFAGLFGDELPAALHWVTPRHLSTASALAPDLHAQVASAGSSYDPFDGFRSSGTEERHLRDFDALLARLLDTQEDGTVSVLLAPSPATRHIACARLEADADAKRLRRLRDAKRRAPQYDLLFERIGGRPEVTSCREVTWG